MYKHSNNKAMTTGAIAAMLSTILYSRRFFPYYVYNIIGGLDEEGRFFLSGKRRGWHFLNVCFHLELKRAINAILPNNLIFWIIKAMKKLKLTGK